MLLKRIKASRPIKIALIGIAVIILFINLFFETKNGLSAYGLWVLTFGSLGIIFLQLGTWILIRMSEGMEKDEKVSKYLKLIITYFFIYFGTLAFTALQVLQVINGDLVNE
jgi:hypothetical protein